MKARKPAVTKKAASKRLAAPVRGVRRGWMPDLRDAGRAKYLALVESIRAAIARGELSGDEPLPSQRELAKHLDVNIATVTKAIAEAGRLGLVSTRPGGRTHVAGAKPGEAASATVDLSINIPPAVMVRPMLDEALGALARRRRGDELFGYAPLGGSFGDREAGARWMGARGLSISPDRVVVTQGAYEGLFASLTAVARPGDAVLCEQLNYTGVRRIAGLCGVRLVGVAVDGEGMQPQALAEACAAHAPKAIISTPTTLNPTTATQGAERRKALLAIARRHEVPIVEDDIYGHLSGDAASPLAALWPEGVLYVCSLSKCVAPGLRAGFVSAPERFSGRVREALSLMGWTAPSLHGAVAAELIVSGLAATCAQVHREEALRRMALARDMLGEGFVHGRAATYHGWLQLPAPWRERDAAAAFQRHGVMVSPAHHFVVGDGPAPAAVRVSLGAVAEIAVLQRALQTLAGVLDSRASVPSSIA